MVDRYAKYGYGKTWKTISTTKEAKEELLLAKPDDIGVGNFADIIIMMGLDAYNKQKEKDGNASKHK